jgi:hypothetical protein
VRRFLHILGTVTLVIVVAACIGLGVVIYKGHALDAESHAFVDRVVPTIAAGWNAEQLFDRATPELRTSVKPAELTALLNAVGQLGPLVEYQGAKGDANLSYIAGAGGSVTASYVAKAKFRDGTASIQIALVKRDGRWLISGFYVHTALSATASRGI